MPLVSFQGLIRDIVGIVAFPSLQFNRGLGIPYTTFQGMQLGQRDRFQHTAGCIDFFHCDMAAGQGENGTEIAAGIGIRVSPLLHNGKTDPDRWVFNPEMVRMAADADIRRIV